MNTPKTGGRYKRAADGTITRVDRAAATAVADKNPQPVPTDAAAAAEEGSETPQEDD